MSSFSPIEREKEDVNEKKERTNGLLFFRLEEVKCGTIMHMFHRANGVCFFVLDDRLKFLDLVSVLDAFMHIEMDAFPWEDLIEVSKTVWDHSYHFFHQ